MISLTRNSEFVLFISWTVAIYWHLERVSFCMSCHRNHLEIFDEIQHDVLDMSVITL